MGWNDRDYNAGREEMRGYLANPSGWLGWSVPLYKSAGLQIRLGFFFLLIALFIVVRDLQGGVPQFIPTDLGLWLGLCLWHELGHRVFARSVGGNHWEWVLSCFGGSCPPTAPSAPKPVFVANVGGVVFSLGLQAVALLAALAAGGSVYVMTVFMILPVVPVPVFPTVNEWVAHSVLVGTLINMTIGLFNLFPSFSLDGGRIWTAVLWPKLGHWKATMVVCLVGMILAVPMFALAVWATSLLSMVFWAFIFAGNFQIRRQLSAAGPGVMDEDEGPSYNYMDTGTGGTRKKSLRKRWFGNSLRKKAKAEQAEQAKIDAILAKVKEKGLHSLTWWEKRTLRKATERQRQQDLAERY